MTEKNKSIRNFPNLRFPGFDGEWKTVKLDDITSWSSGGTPSKENPLFWNGEIPWISASSMRGLVYSNSEIKITELGLQKGSRLAKKGSLLILVRGSMLFNKIPIGIVSRDLAFNQDVKSIVVNEQSSSEYILNWFSAFETKILSMVTGTGIGAGKLDLADLKSLELKIPILSEQNKISHFLSLVNSRIQTQKKIIEGLKTSKLSLSNNIFAQKLRFKDSNDKIFPPWSYKTLGEVGEIINGLTYSPNDINESGVLVLRSSNVHNRILVLNDNVFVKTINFNAVKEDDILICVRNGSKNLIGKNTIIKKENEGLAFGAFMSVYRSDYNKFIYHWFDTNDYKEIVKKNLGATINSINGTDLKKFKIPFPSVEEQKKIANFLKDLDDKINLEIELLKQYENQKKYLLQNLFV